MDFLEEEIVSIDTKLGKVKALGLEIAIKPEQLKVFVNGIDLIKNVRMESLKIMKVE